MLTDQTTSNCLHFCDDGEFQTRNRFEYGVGERINVFVVHITGMHQQRTWTDAKCCCAVNRVKRLGPQGKTQRIIHSSSATQLTRKVRSSCVEICGGKRPRCQGLLWLSPTTQASVMKDLVPGPIDTSKWFYQNLRLVASMGRKQGSSRQKVWLHVWMMSKMLITESPKTPGHYRYLKLGPRLHPLSSWYGIGGVQFAISRVPVYTAISNF